MNYWDKSDGGFILITFTAPLTSEIAGNEAHFAVSWQEYSYVPGGTLVQKSGTVASTFAGRSPTQVMLELDAFTRFHSAVGAITVTYDGAGTLAGEGGPVEAFTRTFTPTDLVPKPNQNANGHIDLGLTAGGVLTRIYHTSVKTGDEHLELQLSASGALTHVDDI